MSSIRDTVNPLLQATLLNENPILDEHQSPSTYTSPPTNVNVTEKITDTTTRTELQECPELRVLPLETQISHRNPVEQLEPVCNSESISDASVTASGSSSYGYDDHDHDDDDVTGTVQLEVQGDNMDFISGGDHHDHHVTTLTQNETTDSTGTGSASNTVSSTYTTTSNEHDDVDSDSSCMSDYEPELFHDNKNSSTSKASSSPTTTMSVCSRTPSSTNKIPRVQGSGSFGRVESKIKKVEATKTHYFSELAGFNSKTTLGALILIIGFGLTKRMYTAVKWLMSADWFNKRDFYNYTYVSSLRNLLPSLPLFEYTSDQTKTVYLHSLFDVLRRIILFPGNVQRMVFFPKAGGTYTKELWHGAAWRTDPRFTLFCCQVGRQTTDRKKFRVDLCDDIIFSSGSTSTSSSPNDLLQLGKIWGIVVRETEINPFEIKNQTLSEALDSITKLGNIQLVIKPYRLSGKDGKSLLLDLDQDILISPEDVFEKIHVVCNKGTTTSGSGTSSSDKNTDFITSNGANTTYTCNEALEDGEVKPRATVRQHPYDVYSTRAEFISQVPEGMPILRLFLIWFYDAFGALSKVYHKTGGGYLTLGNLPLTLQNQLHNLIPLLMVPPKGDENIAVTQIFDEQMLALQNGVILNCGPIIGDVFIIGGIGVNRMDQPQGNDSVGVRRQGARCGCRACMVLKSELSNINVSSQLRTKQLLQAQSQEVEEQDSKAAREKKLQVRNSRG